ncbi:MAG TPA: VOC family protein [Candidatus Saccharimonadales bacterium]|nr:VOC family protein [Candidatus Saccharimonadales bacterium]
MAVTGIGGIFFRAKDPQGLNAWYAKYFGVNDMHVNYEPWLQQEGPTVFALFSDDDHECFGDVSQQFMLNFRVDNLEELVGQLKSDKVKIVKEIENQEGVGHFASIEDPEGNRIELWEPSEE